MKLPTENMDPQGALSMLIGYAEGNGVITRAEGDRLIAWIERQL